MPTGHPTFEALLEAAPDAMVGVDAAGVAAFANARAKELLGRDPVGAPLGELPAGLNVSRCPMGEYELVVLRTADPRALRAVLDNTTAAIFLKDPEGRYLLVNRAFERLHGKPAAQLIGRHDREVLPPEVADRMRVDDLRVMSSREPIELQEEVTHGEHTRTFLSVKFPLIDERSGEIYGVGGIATDITHHVRLEARLREAQRLEAVGQLAGGVAHDFNNLLAVVANYAAFVRKELPDDSRTAGDVDQIIAASRRASELTRRLLLFSRRQSGTPEVLSLRRVIESLELLLHRTLGDDVDLQVDVDDRLWDVEADRSQLEQMLMSLAMNSREAMPEGGTLRIEATNAVMRDPDGPSSRAVKVVVADTGRGMAKEVAAHAFEPFFTTKAVSGHGVGLGLATVYGIVTKARGRIELESEPGQGTTVTITLPAVRRASDDHPSPSAPRGRGETVLVVEDADAVRMLTGRILYAAGYQVISVESGAVALERLDAADVLVTDVVMPGMSGVELAVQARERRPGLPVVFVSGYTGDTPLGGTDDPVTAFLAKPFDGDELLREVRSTLDAAKARETHS
ncbi:PAS domain-containing protein [Solirubrobacter sp. CPCC 204708]|uniref:histidine kinase n=1 Tax=Solirubrobacter deserti TaxID=2282478 RepID=A0ABT4RL07_9ACTN|nr:PAS domain-containing protein [Solirubrobacter deserti]MBE2319046.1 PAS domain-containing protein [Solirubrobacter deserti]MDA0139123.1 PAS domain-containing protein [Solirubrobacter deserti]